MSPACACTVALGQPDANGKPTAVEIVPTDIDQPCVGIRRSTGSDGFEAIRLLFGSLTNGWFLPMSCDTAECLGKQLLKQSALRRATHPDVTEAA